MNGPRDTSGSVNKSDHRTDPSDRTAALSRRGELTFTWSCGDEVPGEGTGLLSPTSKRGVGAAPPQGLAGWGPGPPLVSGARPGLAWGVRSVLGCTSSPEEEREELAKRLAEVAGVSGAWTAGSEELLGTTGGSRSSPGGVWPGPSDDRLSTLRAGDGVAEGGSECERREVWRAGQTNERMSATRGGTASPHAPHSPQGWGWPWKPKSSRVQSRPGPREQLRARTQVRRGQIIRVHPPHPGMRCATSWHTWSSRVSSLFPTSSCTWRLPLLPRPHVRSDPGQSPMEGADLPEEGRADGIKAGLSSAPTSRRGKEPAALAAAGPGQAPPRVALVLTWMMDTVLRSTTLCVFQMRPQTQREGTCPGRAGVDTAMWDSALIPPEASGSCQPPLIPGSQGSSRGQSRELSTCSQSHRLRGSR